MAYKDPEDARLYQKKWQENHPEKVKSYQKKYSDTHKNERHVRNQAWKKAHPEKVQKYNRTQQEKGTPQKSYLRHREENIARTKKYNNEHAKEKLAYNRAYRADNKEKVAAWKKADYARRPGEDNTRRRAAKANAPVNDLTGAQWLEIQVIYDHRCVYCNKRAKGHLTKDHLIPLSKGGSHTAANIAPACRSCNSRKHAGPLLSPVQSLLLLVAPSKKKSPKE